MAKESNDYQEKEFDDEVYEDDYYDNEEELSDDHEKEIASDEDTEEEEVKIHMSFACEEICLYIDCLTKGKRGLIFGEI